MKYTLVTVTSLHDTRSGLIIHSMYIYIRYTVGRNSFRRLLIYILVYCKSMYIIYSYVFIYWDNPNNRFSYYPIRFIYVFDCPSNRTNISSIRYSYPTTSTRACYETFVMQYLHYYYEQCANPTMTRVWYFVELLRDSLKKILVFKYTTAVLNLSNMQVTQRIYTTFHVNFLKIIFNEKNGSLRP